MDGPYYSLKALSSLDFLAIGQMVSSERGLAAVLRTRDEVHQVRRLVACGVITKSQIQEFVEEIAPGVTIGSTSAYDVTLAALAVVMESQPGPFAKQFLESLAALRAVEFPRSPQVAQVCLLIQRQRFAKATVERRQFFPEGQPPVVHRAFIEVRIAQPIATTTVDHRNFLHEIA